MKNEMLDIILLIITISMIVVVGKTEYRNGRIELCKEIGYIHIDDKCISPFEFNLKYNHTRKLPEINLDLNIMGENNATIL